MSNFLPIVIIHQKGAKVKEFLVNVSYKNILQNLCNSEELKQSASPTERMVIMVMTKNARQMLMGDIETTPDIFLESKDMRDKCISRIELLDKVKQIFLLPELECLTTKQMADYFEVGYEAIQSQYKRNKNEFEEDGVVLKSPLISKLWVVLLERPKIAGLHY